MHLLAIGAHADDVEIGCGGTLALAVRLGHEVSILDLTAGELGSNGDPARRAAEAAAAAAVLGVARRENAGLPDGGLDGGDAGQRRALVAWLRRLGPDLVITHCGQNRHPDHNAAQRLVWDAAFLAGLARYPGEGPARRPARILEMMERYPFAPSLVVDIGETAAVKRAALDCYASQFSRGTGLAETTINHPAFLDQILARDRFYGAQAGCAAGEPFFSRQVPLLRDPSWLLAAEAFGGGAQR